jgi:hypothetical protein
LDIVHDTFVFMDVESSLSKRAGRAYGANAGVEARHVFSLSFRSWDVTLYASSGGGRNVIGK